ncbi:MAG: YkgJ family cysteine cluster protein [Phycisphaeraceae bacterium]|nr:YkgJ family cysteine cluster protein [Phycisphaeraceae bacterium]MBX3367552.1 YkgJ family cysteine cluster protein [Phycisphaeraceae bacterium]
MSEEGTLRSMAADWLRQANEPAVVAELEAIYAEVAREITTRGPACWASGRCCNFEKTGHRLYTTGLEAAYTVVRLARLAEPRGLTGADVEQARASGGCPFQERNLCGVHPVRPLGCRVYFCDRTAQEWQFDLTERGMVRIRELHDRYGIVYAYAEWRELLEAIVD